MCYGVKFAEKITANTDLFQRVKSQRVLVDLEPGQGIVHRIQPGVVQHELRKAEALVCAHDPLPADGVAAGQDTAHSREGFLESGLEIGGECVGQAAVRARRQPVKGGHLGGRDPKKHLVWGAKRTHHAVH